MSSSKERGDPALKRRHTREALAMIIKQKKDETSFQFKRGSPMVVLIDSMAIWPMPTPLRAVGSRGISRDSIRMICTMNGF